jgi:hypothetical protein
MTCVVGLVHEGTVYIGADSAGVSGLDLVVRSDPKVFANGEFLIGYTTSFRMGQLLRFNLTPPAHPRGMDAYEFMVRHFVPAVRDCLKEGGFAAKHDEAERGGTFLVGYQGELFVIEPDYQVGTMVDHIFAVGCGAQIALGALTVSSGEPVQRIRRALEAAGKWSAGVRAPFIIKSLEA